jgi:hypothetical protein
MSTTYHGRNMVRHVGRCIYCYAGPEQVKLTDEHIVPFSLGADNYLKEASCPDCQEITRDFETHLARNVFGQLRIHIGVQTRHPEQRPTALPTHVIRAGKEQRVLLPIADHPNFLVMPIWDTPGAIRGEPPQKSYTGLVANIYHHVPPNAGNALGLRHLEVAKIRAENRVDTDRFARAIAKIAYCQAVAIYGLDGFKPLAIRDVILGKYTGISQFVGSRLELPPPREERGKTHMILVYDASITHRLRLLLAAVRLFADAGTPEHGMPIYTVVVGQPIPERDMT